MVAALPHSLIVPVLLLGLLSPLGAVEEVAYDWRQLRIDGGGWVTGQILHPSVPGLHYVRTDVGGLYRRQAGEQRWVQLAVVGSGIDGAHGIHTEAIGLSAADPDRLYVWIGSGTASGFYRSNDRGISFTRSLAWGAKRADPNGPGRTLGERIAVDPSNPDVVWVGTRQDGVWYSHDGAVTWTQVPTATIPVGALNGSDVIGNQLIRFDPSSAVVGGRTQRLYTTANGTGFYRSDDAGVTWTRISGQASAPAHGVTVTDAEIASDGRLYLTASSGGGADGGVWRYTPGATAAQGAWALIRPPEASRGPSYDDVAVDPGNPARLWVIRSGGRDLARSDDAGATWTALSSWRPGPVSSAEAPWINAGAAAEAASAQSSVWSWLSVGDLSCDANGVLWLAEGFGVWRFDQARSATSVAWTNAAAGIEETVAFKAVRVPGGPLVTATADLSGFRWDDPNSAADHQLTTLQFSSTTDIEVYTGAGGPILYAVSSNHHSWGAGSSFSGWSADGGRSWTRFATVLNGDGNVLNEFGDLAVSATNPDVLVWAPAGRFWTSNLLYRSSDRGASWTAVTPPWPADQPGLRIDMWTKSEFLVADPVAANTFYIYHRTSGVFRSQDGGATWQQRSQPQPTQANGLPQWGWGSGALSARPGVSGELWYCAGTARGFRAIGPYEGGGLWRSLDAGASWSLVDTMDNARQLAWGPALPGSSHPTLVVHGLHDGVAGLYRSSDLGVTWQRLGDGLPLGLLDDLSSLAIDAEVPDRVIVGFAGSGFAIGRPTVQVQRRLTIDADAVAEARLNGGGPVALPAEWTVERDEPQTITFVSVSGDG